MEVTARRAEEADLAGIGALAERARSEVAGQRSGPLHLASELGGEQHTLATDEGDPDRLVAVAEVDQVVVGYLFARIVETGDGRRVCRVAALYVEPEAREVGAGEELIGLLTSWAIGAGAEGIDVVALPGSREVKNFFESQGFAARLIVMHRRLG